MYTIYIHSGEGNGNPLQYCLGSPVDGGAWWAAVCGVAQSQTRLTRLSMHTCMGPCYYAQAFSSWTKQGLLFSCDVQASHCSNFSL